MKTLVSTSVLFTNRNENTARYFSELNAIKPISASALDALFDRVAQGDQRAADQIVRHNLKLVVSIAKRYENVCTLTLNDLINEGNIGLILAVKKFDKSRGCAFATLAAVEIWKAILHAINEYGRAVRYPMNAIKNTYISQSTDAPLGSDEDGNEKTLLDTLKFAADGATDSGCEIDDAKVIVAHLLGKIKRQKDKEIICALFGIGETEKSLSYLADKYDCTEEAVRQIKFRTLLQMTKIMDALDENF